MRDKTATPPERRTPPFRLPAEPWDDFRVPDKRGDGVWRQLSEDDPEPPATVWPC